MMRGYAEHGQLKSAAEIRERNAIVNGVDSMEYKAALAIAGHGTYQGNWVLNRAVAENELNELIGRHIPGGMPSAGIPAYVKHADYQQAA